MDKHKQSLKSKKRKFDRVDRSRDAISSKTKQKKQKSTPQIAVEETWNPTSADLKEGRKYFQQLVHPLPIPTLIEHWEDQQPLLIRRKKIKEEQSDNNGNIYLDKLSSEKLFEILANESVYFKKDAKSFKYSSETNSLEYNTDLSGLVKESIVNKLIREKWTVTIQNLDLASSSLGRAHYLIDKFWQGEGGCHSVITMTPANCQSFAPYSEAQDKLIFQIEGSFLRFLPLRDPKSIPLHIGKDLLYCSQKLTLYTVDDSYEGMTSNYLHGPAGVATYLNDEWLEYAEVVLETTLNKGDMLFVPEACVLVSEALDETALDVTLAFSSHPSWQDVLDSALGAAQELIGLEDDAKVFPNDLEEEINIDNELQPQFRANSNNNNNDEDEDDDGELDLPPVGGKYSKMKENLAALLTTSVEMLDRATLRFEARSEFSRTHFNVAKWIQQYNIDKLLADNNGLVKISNFLPNEVANRIYQTYENLDESEWKLTEATENKKENNIDHVFMSSRNFPNHDVIFNIIRQLKPQCESTFSAGQYLHSHFIDPHDDRAYKTIGGKVHSRSIAVIYYLTPNWTEEEGGALIDIDGDSKKYVPEFNSLIAFTVPRWHQVEVMQTDRPRYSIFGWFLEPGQLYDLDT